jgi:hypothetical protein
VLAPETGAWNQFALAPPPAIGWHGVSRSPQVTSTGRWYLLGCPHAEILDLITEATRAALRLRYTGHHLGEILGTPATGILVTYHGAAFFTARNGRLAEAWVLGDVDSLRRLLT